VVVFQTRQAALEILIDESIFLSGLALFRMDIPRARLSIDILERRKAVTPEMWDRYCPLDRKLDLHGREEVCAAAKHANMHPA